MRALTRGLFEVLMTSGAYKLGQHCHEVGSSLGRVQVSCVGRNAA